MAEREFPARTHSLCERVMSTHGPGGRLRCCHSLVSHLGRKRSAEHIDPMPGDQVIIPVSKSCGWPLLVCWSFCFSVLHKLSAVRE